MARDNIKIDPIALIGVCLTLVGLTAGGTWFVISQIENAESALLKKQVEFLGEQVQLRRQEVEETADILRKISTFAKNHPELQKIVGAVLKESVGILGPRELGINEAVLIPNTEIRIVYEDVGRYPSLKHMRKLLPSSVRKYVMFPNSLQVR